MNRIEKMLPEGKREKQVKLSEVPTGEVFRFPTVTFEEALSKKDDSSFYKKINTQPQKLNRVTVVSLDGKLVVEKDDDHLVIVHPTRIRIGEAEMI